MNRQPPKWADRFLEWYCNPDLLEDLQGDLYEVFYNQVDQGKPRKARLYYLWLVLRSFRYSAIKRNSKLKKTTFVMTKSNLKIALRVLKNNKFYTGLNLTGLAIGIMCFFLTGFYIKQELSYDQFNSKKGRIYRVWLKEVYSEEKIFFSSHTPLLFERFLEDNFGEFETAIQVDGDNYLVGTGSDRINENISVVSPEIFMVFDFGLIEGNMADPLQDKRDLVLSKSYARKYFGEDLAIGKVLPIEMQGEIMDFTVTAVFEDIPKESSVQFDMAISNENNEELYDARALNHWFQNRIETYVLVGENSSISSVEAAIDDVIMGLIGGQVNEGEYNVGFQPLTDVHLNPDIPVGGAPVGNPSYVAILGVISILVLVTACVNYATLSVGQSLKRTKEVGVRKVMGAQRKSLINQYLSESLLIIVVAFGMGIGLTYLSLPIFNELTGADVRIDFQVWHLGLYLALILIVGLTSGIYPAILLSRQKATDIFRGSGGARSKQYIRKGMVVFQFLITVFLISSTLIMRKQLNYMQNKDMGVEYNATVSVPLYRDPAARSLADAISTAMEKGELLKEKLNIYPEISDLGMGSHVFGNPGWAKLSYSDNTETYRAFRVLAVDAHYLNTFGIELKKGKNFDPESELDKRQSIILNQSAVELFGLDEPIGSRLPGNDFGDHSIIGVTENFNYASLHSAVEPLIITQNVQPIVDGVSDFNFQDSPIPKLVFKYSGKKLSDVREILTKEWETTFPEEELNFSFVEENMKAQYANEKRMNRLLSVATVLSIIIASLGLLGLTVLVINGKQKEIGIRKVIGASEASIFKLLVSSFSWQLLLGVVLSVPFTYGLMNDWLKDFAYRIDLGIDIFLFGGLISLVIAFFTISFHTLKASLVNPVDTIRSE
ncbi:MAG: ABC transporter permease [Bacteroidota bacterium]